MKELPKEKITGIAATVIFHILLVVLLYFLVMTTPPQQEEMGIEVQMGIDNDAFGDRLAMAETPASVPSSVPAPEPEPQPAPSLTTQDVEESITVPPQPQPRKETPAQPTEAELREQQEREQREAEERRLREREAASMAQANSSVANAFARGNAMNGNSGSSAGSGTQGSPGGNSVNGIVANVGNRSALSLSRPAYNVQAQGVVVVNVVVRPNGTVESATINARGTNTSDSSLRNAALAAARASKFNAVEGNDNVNGTITYNFKLR